MPGNNEKETLEFVKDLALKVEEKKRKFEGTYIMNPENYQRFVEVYTYFRIFADENEGKLTHLDIAPTSIHADVSIDVPIVDLFKDSLKGFTDILSKVDVFGITPTASDSLLIDASVNYVWKAVPKG